MAAIHRDPAVRQGPGRRAVRARAKKLMTELHSKKCLPPGWSTNAGGRKNVSMTLQVASWEPEFEALALCPLDVENPPFLAAAVEELARAVE